MKYNLGKRHSYSVSIIGRREYTSNYGTTQETYSCYYNNDNYVTESKNNAISNDKVNNLQSQNNEGCDFETAIQETKYGKYNLFLLSIGLWGYMSAMFSTTTMSLILPQAGCDMQLNNFDKGMLNAVVYVGMISTAFFGGLVSDAIGRRFILLLGYAADAIFCILIGLSQSFTFLLVIKLLSGFVNSSLIAILTSFVAENHASQYRASVTIGMGIFISVGTIILPLLGWLIIPLPIHLTLFNGYIYLPSWKIFLLTSSIPSILAYISLCFADESPKFLMSQNKNDEAFKVFRRIYSKNTGNPIEMYPVQRLKTEQLDHSTILKKGNITCKKIIDVICEQVVPFFHKPYLSMTLLFSVMKLCTLSSANTIRLWSPELFALSIEHEDRYNDSSTVSSLCELLSLGPQTNLTQIINDCSEKTVDKEVYFNSMIMGIITGMGYLISSYAVKILDRKWLLIVAYEASFACCVALYWCPSSAYLLAVISMFVAFTSSAATILSSVIIDIFPTYLRTTALNLCLTFGRLGALSGNLVFPLLLDWNCVSPFIFLAVSLSGAAALTLFLPTTKGENLK